MNDYTRNGQRREGSGPMPFNDQGVDFKKLRAEMLNRESVERRDAYNDYNRGGRSF